MVIHAETDNLAVITVQNGSKIQFPVGIGFGVDPLYTGIALTVFTGLVIIGGLNSLSRVTTLLVPFMALFYIAGSLVVIFGNLSAIPGAIASVVKYAFEDPQALPGALAGWAVK